LHAGGRPLAFGTGAFMVMAPPPGQTMYPLMSAVHAGATPLAESELDERERAILARADATLREWHAARGFLRRLWGFLPEMTSTGARCVTANGPHLGNRVGHFQGGLQMGMAIETAACALPADWTLSGAAAFFLRRGEGASFVAEAHREHHGRNTAVLRTIVTDGTGRKVLVVETTHAR
jgi:acyl-coenzyme A thioesterase PaaI-like protein